MKLSGKKNQKIEMMFTIIITVRMYFYLEEMRTTKYKRCAVVAAGFLATAGISNGLAGTLAMPDPLNFVSGANSFSVTSSANSVEWFSFSVPTIASPDFLDITVGAGNVLIDPKIAIYTAPAGALVVEDDNSSPGFFTFEPLLSFGDASAPGGGANGTLSAGSYLLAVGTSSFFGILGDTDFTSDAASVTSDGPAFTGTITVNSTVPAAVPEPARAGLLFLGLFAAGAASRKRRS